MTFKKYTKLEKEIDKAAIRELAEIKTEMQTLDNRLIYLEELFNENEDLQKYLWQTQNGTCIPIFDLPDDHLENIINMYRSQSKTPRKEIIEEYERRDKKFIPPVLETTLEVHLPF